MDESFSNSFNEEEIKDIIREALVSSTRERKKRVQSKQLASALSGTLNEFLDSFVLFGYDLDGKGVILKSESTDQQHEALKSLLIKYIAYTFNGYD